MQQLDTMEKEGIISSVKYAEWTAPIVPVLKSDKESVSICGDYKRTVDQAIKVEPYPLPRIEDLFTAFAGGETGTKLDLSQAYTQIPLYPSVKKYTVINTPKGLYKFNWFPFGISSAPAIFQRMMESLLQGLQAVAVYLDDMLITGRDGKEHYDSLQEILKRLKEAGLRLKREKCTVAAPSVVYLGHRIDTHGLHPTGDKLQALRRAHTPTNMMELKSFLSFLNNYGKFIPRLASSLGPLYELLKTPTLEVDGATGRSIQSNRKGTQRRGS